MEIYYITSLREVDFRRKIDKKIVYYGEHGLVSKFSAKHLLHVGDGLPVSEKAFDEYVTYCLSVGIPICFNGVMDGKNFSYQLVILNGKEEE